ncbi:phospholipid-transporting ATPase ABCA3-like [Glandiceps talaboti]
MGAKARQLRCLLWKNFTLQWRRPIGTVFEILIPVVLVSLLVVARIGLETNFDKDMCFENYVPSNFYTVYDREQLQKAQSSPMQIKRIPSDIPYELYCNQTKSCRDLAWWPQTNLTNRLMLEVEWILHIKLTDDTFESEEDMTKTVSAKTDTYHAAVVFDFPTNESSLPLVTPYRIRISSDLVRFNSWFTSRTYPYYTLTVPVSYNLYEDRFLALQHALDYTIIKFQNEESNDGTFQDMVDIRREVQRFPYPEWKVETFITTMQFLMPIMMCLALIYSAASITKELVLEKETRLKETMKMMGLSNWLHWTAWFVKCLIFLLISGLLMSIILKVGEVFRYSAYGCILILFTLWIIAGIMWCFAVSVLFSKAKIAMIFAVILWFLNYVVVEFITKDYFNITANEKVAACLLHNTCLGVAIQTIARLESEHVGMTWSTLNMTPSPGYDVPIAVIWTMFCIDIIIYGLFAWYVEAVFPGEYGIARKVYFPLQKSYWLGTTHNSVTPQSALCIELKEDPKPSPNFEPAPDGMNAGISIKHLGKRYANAGESKDALTDLCMNMYEDQITSLLGQNGAGKTTTMSILTGLFPPTTGTAIIDGHDILTGMTNIRHSLGFCPQHNILFDRLTVKEHLDFCLGLKGIVGTEAVRSTETMVEDLGLVEKTNCRSSVLSGGMKRKVSVALALIGQPRVVMLDEPTSGLDPCSRRSTWDLLLKHKRGKTILLTTHSMDEADLLGDRIAIMSNGQLVCSGTSLFLKNRFGIGYNLTLAKQAECKTGEIDNRISRHVSGSVLRSESGAELSFNLPREGTSAFTELCKDLEDNRSVLGIESFGISVTTLEDVFVQVDNLAAKEEKCLTNEACTSKVEEYRIAADITMELSPDLLKEVTLNDRVIIDSAALPFQDMNSTCTNSFQDTAWVGKYTSTENMFRRSDSKDDMADICTYKVERQDNHGGLELKWQQFRAIFIKRLLHSKRDRKAIITQLILPLVFVLFGLLLNVLSPRYTDNLPRTLTMHNLSAENPNAMTFYADLRTGADDRDVFMNLPDLLSEQNLPMINVTDSVYELKSDNSGTLKDGEEITDSMDCCYFDYLIVNAYCADIVTASKPYNENMCSEVTEFSYYNCPHCVLNPGYYNYFYNKSCPVGSDVIALRHMKTYFEEFILRDSSVGSYFNDHVAGFTLSNDQRVAGATLVTVWYSNQPYHASAEAMAVLDNALLHFMTNTSYVIVVTNDPLPASTANQVSDTTEQSLILAICVVFGLGFLAASFSPFLISEKASKAKLLQFLSGLDPLSYWFGTLVWDCINYCVVLILLIILFAIFTTSYAPPNLGETTLLLILFGWAAIPMTYALSGTFTSPLTGYGLITALYTLGAMATMITVFILELLDNTEGQAITCDYIFMLLPTHCLGRALISFAENVVAKEQCTSSDLDLELCEATGIKYEENILAWSKPGVGQHCLYLFLEGIFWAVITLLLEGNFSALARPQLAFTRKETNVIEEDEDVKREKHKVETLVNPANTGYAVVLTNLTKVYSSIFHCIGRRRREPSVDHLCLTIPKGECFGLLGINGAGKTTTHRMVIGDLAMTEGMVHIGGYNIKTERREAQRQIGYCPQFDALIDKLTGREVLLMYARLRGIRAHTVEGVVDSCIKHLNLSKWADKICGNYSGGNKRKLSIATAIVGNPPIVFLDEPTAGMDPKSRRALWNLITRLKDRGRCIVLTSHSMEECEALCTRLAIMVNGKFKCIGSTQHLKSRFGKGYQLMVKVGQAADTHQIKEFVNNSFPGAKLSTEHMGMLQYHIENKDLKWSYIFGEIEDHKDELQLIDYSVGQTSLEQVFIDFAREQQNQQTDQT